MMRSNLQYIKNYTKKIGGRPTGYERNPGHLDSWETHAWRELKNAPFRAWDIIAPIKISAEKMFNLPGTDSLDRPDSQELSEQFYSIYEDMLLEFLRNPGDLG